MGPLTFDEHVTRGRAVRYLLDQTTHWQPDGEPVRRLIDLETSHLSNIRNYLLRHRRWFYFYYAVGDAFLEPMFAEMRDKHDIPLFVEKYEDDSDPSWLYETALWQQIDQLIEARCLRDANGRVDFSATG